MDNYINIYDIRLQDNHKLNFLIIFLFLFLILSFIFSLVTKRNGYRNVSHRQQLNYWLSRFFLIGSLISLPCVFYLKYRDIKTENKIKRTEGTTKIKTLDTLFKDEKTCIVKNKISVDTFLKFNSVIDDSIYFVKLFNIKDTKALDFSNYEYKKMYLTATKDGVKENGVNFAGHYSFSYWGCGSPCQLSAVVDMKTGKVYNGLPASNGYKCKPESKILIINPPDSTDWYNKNIIWRQPSEYVWTGKTFEEIKNNR